MQSLEILRPCQTMDCVATVLASVPLTPTIKAIHLGLDDDRFRFLPGQSVWPRFERNGKQFTKIYSIASSPVHCPEVELCVSRVGWSSAYLQDLPVGAHISVRGPYGLMTLNQLPGRPRLYIAEGSGIAPLKSQIDWLYGAGFSGPVCLIQSNPETPTQLPYESYWQKLQMLWPNFHYEQAIATLPEECLARQSLDLSQWDVEICAVNERVSELGEAALSLGADAARVRSEQFHAF